MTNKRCECGEVTGVPCEGSTDDAHEIVEWMPPYLRDLHEAARNSGIYPYNGAQRLRVLPECAEMICESDPEWAEVVED